LGRRKGFKHSKETRKKMSESHMGKESGMSGKHHRIETRKKMSEVQRGNQYWLGKKHTEKSKRKMSKAQLGCKKSKETRLKMSECKRGAKSPNWQGGISFLPYPTEWTESLKESIRERDNYVCQLCGIHQDELERNLHIHHIDYNKDNLDPKNLISLCPSCHAKTNFSREKWYEYFN